jgi:endonuclease/exonuclease/phosphatase family metal-dependent hydrolase
LSWFDKEEGVFRRTYLCLLLAAAGAAQAETLRVMSFNVRYPASGDGPNRWEHRRDLMAATIREKAPDVMGTQELFYEQGQYLVEKLPEYAWFGVSRRGNQTDEHMGVFYRKATLRVIESGNFWLSDTPEVAGSMSWDVSLPRMVTWAVFEIKASGRRFLFYNTHLAHRRQDEEARVRSTRLIRERIAVQRKDLPFILVGDFNAPVDGAAYQVFDGLLTDAWKTAAKKSGPDGSFHGFKGAPGPGRIDWILFRGLARSLEVETITKNAEGRYPSDHFPVLALLEF